MHPQAPGVFALPDHLSHKADPARIGADERHFAAVSRALAHTISGLSARLDARRRDPAGRGAQTIERDSDIRRLAAELTTLRRYGPDLCLGHVGLSSSTLYVGRVGLSDADGTELLVGWRAPAAEPFFAATPADPRGVRYRRRYRWSGGRIVDYWDEVLEADDDEVAAHLSPDDHSAFVTGLARARTGRMQDVLATIQADQDAIIRADSRGALVVDGGPGTGKTVVALHRAAYLLHEQSRAGVSRGNLLLVGPHRPYLDYVADVLPALGEHGVQTATIYDLAGEDPADIPSESDPEVARLKSELRMVEAIETAVRFYEQPPEQSMVVQTEWAELRLTPDDWAEACDSVEDGTPHNEAHGQILQTLVAILADRAVGVGSARGGPAGADLDDPHPALRAELAAHAALRRALARAWPVIDARDLIGDLWTVPAYLRLCAPWLTTGQLRALQRSDPRALTGADLPLLDAARHRLGEVDHARMAIRRRAERAAELERRRRVIDEVIAADDDPEGVSPMLRHVDLQEALLDPSAGDDPPTDPAGLAGPFGHVIVDEAQELTDTQWRMILRRCPSGSLTVVGDRAQSRLAFAETWTQRLERIGLSPARIATVHLSINYRTPAEIMNAAAPVIRAVRPDANVPESVRSSGIPIGHGRVEDLSRVLEEWIESHSEGVACVIRPYASPRPGPGVSERVLADSAGRVRAAHPDRVRVLTPPGAKGLEFDLVVIVDPESFGTDVVGAVDRYVAMSRATQQLIELRP